MLHDPKDFVGQTKPKLSLISPELLYPLAQALSHGANKYGVRNWRDPEHKVKTSTYADAALRHLFAYISGEDLDPDSGLPHLAHVAANCNILLDAAHCAQLHDDRLTYETRAT